MLQGTGASTPASRAPGSWWLALTRMFSELTGAACLGTASRARAAWVAADTSPSLGRGRGWAPAGCTPGTRSYSGQDVDGPQSLSSRAVPLWLRDMNVQTFWRQRRETGQVLGRGAGWAGGVVAAGSVRPGATPGGRRGPTEAPFLDTGWDHGPSGRCRAWALEALPEPAGPAIR